MIAALRPADCVMDANDGTSALAIIKKERPDVVLTDIRMPNMDGLEFLGMLENVSARPKVVMVSAYDRFEYAQTAMRHGAYDYLLKPVDQDKVESLLRRVEAALLTETRRESESEALKLQLREAASAYRKRLLLSWLNGGLNDAERQELAELEWLHGSGMVVFSEFYPLAAAGGEGGAEALVADMERVWANYGSACALPLDAPPGSPREIVTIMQLPPPSPPDMERLRRDMAALNEAWSGAGRLCHSMGAAAGSLWEEGPRLLREARSASAYHFYEINGGVLLTGETPLAGEEDRGAAIDSEALFEALQEKEPETAVGMCAAAFDRLATGLRLSPAAVKEHAALLLMKIKSRNREHIERQIGSELARAAVTEVPACRTYKELLALMEAKLRELHQALHAGQEGRDAEVAAECIRWIAEHRKEPITLETAAERFFFNPSYFSTWIKNHTGKTFTEHLLEARMERAAQLLADNRLKIYEVAAECGYTDTKYFCRVFKKHYGLSPERHRQMSLLQRRDETL